MAFNQAAVRKRFTIAAAAYAMLIASMCAMGEERKLGGLESVLGELRKGGLVIFVRHAATEQSTREEVDLSKCETQRNLSPEGREQAAQIGKGFRTLGIPVGTVVTSPFCRCKDTAQLAFGRFSVERDLSFALKTDAAETKRLADSLRRMLSTPPTDATNTIIVAHTANLQEAASLWPKPEGAAYVFRPLANGGFEALAKIAPEEWTKVALRRAERTH